MPAHVTDARSNPNDQIAHAANVLKRSARLLMIFKIIYRGKRKAKRVSEIMKVAKLGRVVVLQQGGKLAGQQLVHQIKLNGETAYEKDPFYAANKPKIISLATNPTKRKAYPTKYNQAARSGPLTVSIKGRKVAVSEVTVDSFDQFKNTKKIRQATHVEISERDFKNGVQRLLAESGDFPDWGGERNDLFTSKCRLKGQRRTTAFAFKGPGMQGRLTPKKLGKNGDQIQRLFLSPADIFIVQYHGQVDQSVVEQMRAFAMLKSVLEDRQIYYGIIDGDDTDRLIAAYPKKFGLD